MAWAILKQQVRPLKLAFLIAPTDTKSLLQAIQLNSFLWGGRYNFIVPTYGSLPAFLKDHPFNKLTAKRLFYGYLENFDPDFVIPIGKAKEFSYNLDDYQRLDIDELWKNVYEKGFSDYGIGFYEVLDSFIDEELKYTRMTPIDIFIPRISGSMNERVFLGSIVGILPPKVEEIINKDWQKYTTHTKKEYKLINYYESLQPKALNLLNISGMGLERSQDVTLHNKNNLLILDASKNIDIIDFWNLRALGRRICPIPIELMDNVKVINYAKAFLEKPFTVRENYRGDKIEYPVTILKSRSLDAQLTKDFADKVRNKSKKTSNRIVLQNWYPRIWDSWAVEKDGVKYKNYYNDKIDLTLDPKNPSIQISTLSPEFIKNEYLTHTLQFANDLSLSIHDSKGIYAEVIPKSRIPFQRSMSCHDEELWRSSSEYLTYLAKYPNEKIFFCIPKSGELFLEWLDQNDIRNVTFSKSADTSKRLLSKMDSIWEIGHLAHTGVIKVLEEIGQSEFVTRSGIMQMMNDNKIKKQQRIIDWFIKVNVIRMGF